MSTLKGRPIADLIEDVEWYLTEIDWAATSEQVAHRFGYATASGIRHQLQRAGRTDLLDRLARNAARAGNPGRKAS